MNKWLNVLLIFVLFLPACRKNKEENNKLVIKGKISDNADNSGISGATVKMYHKAYENGVYSNSYSLLTSATTDGSGNYTISIDKPNSSAFKFMVDAANYFGIEKESNPDNFTTASENTLNFTTDPACTVVFHFKNVSPVDTNDHLQFHPMGIIYNCLTCCTNAVQDYSGTTVDETFSCLRYAKKYFKYQYYVTKGGATNGYLDSVYTTFGTQVELNILY